MVLSTTTSDDSKRIHYQGTRQEVLDALDDIAWSRSFRGFGYAGDGTSDVWWALVQA